MAYFKKPGYTQVPNEIFDALMPSLSGAQLKVLLWVARQTLGWHRESWKMTMVDIAAATGLSKTGALESIQILEQRGLIIQKRNFINDNQVRATASEYSLSIEEDEESTVNSGDRQKIDGQLRRPSEKSTVNSGDRATVNSGDQYIRNKETSLKTEELKEKTTPSLSQDQSQNLPSTEQSAGTNQNPLSAPASPCDEEYSKSQSTSYELQLDEPVIVFVANAYRQSRGAKVTKAELKRWSDKLASMEAATGPEEFRTSLWIYLNSSTDTLRKGKWPICYFMKYPPAVATLPATQSPRLTVPHTSSEDTATSPAQSAIGQPPTRHDPKRVDYFVDKWNTVVHNRSVDKIYPDTRSQVETAIRDEEFRDRFEELCEACYRLNCGDKEYKFTWLFLVGSGTINWKGVLRGKFDFAMPKLSPSDQSLAAAEREEREAEAAR